MNGVDGDALVTIHVTPEAGFSYASCELHGFSPMSLSPVDTTAAIVQIFQPRRFVASCSYPAAVGSTTQGMDEADSGGSASLKLTVPGYVPCGLSSSVVAGGGRVIFCSFERERGAASESGASESGASEDWNALRVSPSCGSLSADSER